MIAITAIKLVALDMDGTLLDRDHTIPDRTIAAIAAARDRGVQFVIATGRMYQSSVPFAKLMDLHDLPLISYNGALVREYPSGRTIWHEPIPLPTCRALSAFCEARGLHLHSYVNDELYVPNLGSQTQLYLSIAKVTAHPVGSLFLWQSEPATKMLIVTEAPRSPGLQREIQELLGPSVSVMSSLPRFLEIVNSNASKGKALEAVAASMGIERTEVMAVGDAMNDISMLTWAGTGVAMGHAPEPLRQIATFVTRGGPGEGVYEALERMDLIG